MSRDYADNIQTSIHGRQLGLERMSSSKSGGAHGATPFVVGPEALRQQVTTAASTGTNVKAYGVSHLPGTSAGSSSVYTIDPPIPGVGVTIRASTRAKTYLKTENSETIVTTQNSSGFIVACSSAGGAFQLMGYTTGIWLGVGLTSGTSSQSGAFIVSTST